MVSKKITEDLLYSMFSLRSVYVVGGVVNNVAKILLSHDVTSGSEITPCNKIDKPLVVYRFTGIVMTSISTLR